MPQKRSTQVSLCSTRWPTWIETFYSCSDFGHVKEPFYRLIQPFAVQNEFNDWLNGLWCRLQKYFSYIADSCAPIHGFLRSFNQHNILANPLAAFPHKHCWDNGQQRETNKSGCNEYHQASERILGEPGIEPATSCSQVRYAFWLSYGTRHKMNLTLYHTIPTFNDPEKEGFWKHCGKRRKCWYPAFSPFPAMFSTLLER